MKKKFSLKKSKAIAFLLIACMLITLIPMQAFAKSEEKITYQSKEGNYTFTKISKQTNPKDADGIVDITDPNTGEVIGGNGQSYSWSSVGYGENVYIGTCYGAIYNTIVNFAGNMVGGVKFSPEMMASAVDIMWRGNMFTDSKASTVKDFNKAVIVKINTVTGETKLILDKFHTMPSGLTYGTAGYRNAIEFKDKLYFVNSQAPSKIIEVNPENDEVKLVYTAPLAKDIRNVMSSVRAMTVHNGQLLVTICGDVDRDGVDEGVGLIASSNPAQGQDSFKLIAEQSDFLDYPTYHYTEPLMGSGLWDMVSFNGKVYVTASTYNEELPLIGGQKQAGFCLFEGKNNGTAENPDWSFKPIIGKDGDGSKYPISLGGTRAATANLEVYGDHLYIGGYNDPMKALPEIYFKNTWLMPEIPEDIESGKTIGYNFERFYLDLTNPVNLYRMDKNESVELVVGEPDGKVFTEPSLSGLVGGFGKDGKECGTMQYVWDMSTYDNKFYVGAFDISTLSQPIRQFTNGDILKGWDYEEFEALIEDLKVVLGEVVVSKLPAETELKSGEIKTEKNSYSKAEVVEIKETLKDLDKIEALEEIVSEDNFIDEKAVSDDKNQLATSSNANSQIENELKSCEELLTELLNAKEQLEELLGSDLVEEILSKIDMQKIIKELEELEQVSKNLEYFIGSCKILSTSEIGFDAYVSDDGINFDALTTDGLGAEGNHGVRTFAQTTTGLVLGTANPYNGTQIWQITDNNRAPIDNSVVTAKVIEVVVDQSSDAVFNIKYNGNTLKSLQYKETAIDLPTDAYTINGDKAVIKANYINSLGVGKHELRFRFSNNSFQDVTINVTSKEKQAFEIKYNSNGGTGTMQDGWGYYGESVVLSENQFVAPKGHKFVAWAINSVDGEQVKELESYTFVNDDENTSGIENVYAIWENTEKTEPTEPTEPTETTTKKENKDNPQTGDSTNVWLYFIIAFASLGWVILALNKRKSKK